MALLTHNSRRIAFSEVDNFDYPLIDNLPLHWELLSREDLNSYVELRRSFYDEINKSRKGEKLETFIGRILRIRSFVERNDSDDWKRGLVCGIIFLKSSIAIHIQQLRLLLGKCKSSINGSLQAIGFAAHPQGSQIEEELYQKVPIFQRKHSEVKKWTVRECTAQKNPLCRNMHPLPQINLVGNVDDPNERVGREAVMQYQLSWYMVPIKFRYKSYSLYHSSVGVQTDM